MTIPTYVSRDDFKGWAGPGIPADFTELDTAIDTAIDTASRQVEKICGRHFYQTTETQYFSPAVNNPWILDLNDMEIATTTGLAVHVQWSNSGNYSEVRTVDTDFILEPVNQSIAGIDGWPYTQLRSLAKLWPPRYADFYRDTVKIDATFGWPAIPAAVISATLTLALDQLKLKDAPFGFLNFGEYGPTRTRDNPNPLAILQPYKKSTAAGLLMA